MKIQMISSMQFIYIDVIRIETSRRSCDDTNVIGPRWWRDCSDLLGYLRRENLLSTQKTTTLTDC